MSFNWSRNSQWGLFLARTGKSPTNFSSPVLARRNFSSLWCSRAPEFLFSNRCFHAPDFPLPPSCSRTPKLLSPWCSRAPEPLLANRCYRALDFRLSPSPRSRAPCLLLFSSSFWAPYFPLFPLVFLRP